MARPRRFDWLFRPQLADEDMPLSAEARFAEALADLPAVERSALALSEIGGLDTHEIAERLGTDAVIVRKLLVRARESVRTTLALRSRRGLMTLIPFQNWWQSGSSAPAVRAAGAVAAAVVGTGIAIGGASADQPRSVLTNPDPPRVRALEAVGARHESQPRTALPRAAATAAKKPKYEPLGRARNGPARWRAPGTRVQPDPLAASPSPPDTYGEAPDPAGPPATPAAPPSSPHQDDFASGAPAAVDVPPAALPSVPAPPLDLPPVALPPITIEPPPSPLPLPAVPPLEVPVVPTLP